jgi:hypothetical protein
MRFEKLHIRRGIAAALLAALLAACGPTGQTTEPTPGAPVASQPTSAPQPAPTSAPRPAPSAQPAPTTKPQPAPSAQPAPTTKPQPAPSAQPAPTAKPQAQPIIGFNPKAGAPGTIVSVFGSGYTPGAPIKVRLGLPSATGDVLASAFAGADGRWSASLTVPNRLPSGEIIDADQIYLVAMDDANIALASAPFALSHPTQDLSQEAARQTVRDLLSAWSGSDFDTVNALLAKPMRDELDSGRPLFSVLGMQGDRLDSFEIREPMPSEIMLVLATLHYSSFDDNRFYHLVVEDGRWKIAGTNEAQQPQPDRAVGPMDTVARLLGAMQQDRTLRDGLAIPYLGGPLRASVESGKMAGASAILQEGRPFADFRVEREIASEGDQVYVEATLIYDDRAEAGRIFTTSAYEDGVWKVFKVTPSDVLGKPDAGSGWLPLVQGDFNQDGLEETVYVLPSDVTPQDHFGDANLDANAIVVKQLRIEQAGAHGPWAMLTVDRLTITADKILGSFTSDAAPIGPDAFLLAFTPASDTLINLLPLTADGHAYAQGVALNWSRDANAYRIVGPHGTP